MVSLMFCRKIYYLFQGSKDLPSVQNFVGVNATGTTQQKTWWDSPAGCQFHRFGPGEASRLELEFVSSPLELPIPPKPQETQLNPIKLPN